MIVYRLKMKILRAVNAIAFALCVVLSCQKSEMEPSLELDSNTIDVPATGGSYSVTVTSTVEYKVVNSNAKDWVVLDGMTEDGFNVTFNLTVKPNPTFETRRGIIKFSGQGVPVKVLSINQEESRPKGVWPESLKAEPDQTSASFTVYAADGVRWVAGSSSPEFKLDRTSGVGQQTVNVSFEANSGTYRSKKADITVEIGKDIYVLPIVQSFNGLIAEWNIRKLIDDNVVSQYWNSSDQGKDVAGFGSSYCPASEGDGTIRYYGVDKSGYAKLGKANKEYFTCRTFGNKYGCLMAYSAIPGDYWLITVKSPVTLPAGSTVKFHSGVGVGAAAPCRWLWEYNDGGRWKPMMPLVEETENATSFCYSGGETSYTSVVTCNHTAKSMYEVVDAEFLIYNDTDEIQIRWTPVGEVDFNGLRLWYKLSDSSYSRISSVIADDPDTEEYEGEKTRVSIVSLAE